MRSPKIKANDGGQHAASVEAGGSRARHGPHRRHGLAIPAVLRRLGCDPDEVLAEAGVDVRLFDDPENQISYLRRGRLLDICVNRTGCPHFGLLVGQRNGLEALGWSACS